MEGNTVTISGVLWHNICLLFGEDGTGAGTTSHIWHSHRLRRRANWIGSMLLAYNVPGGEVEPAGQEKEVMREDYFFERCSA